MTHDGLRVVEQAGWHGMNLDLEASEHGQDSSKRPRSPYHGQCTPRALGQKANGLEELLLMKMKWLAGA